MGSTGGRGGGGGLLALLEHSACACWHTSLCAGQGSRRVCDVLVSSPFYHQGN